MERAALVPSFIGSGEALYIEIGVPGGQQRIINRLTITRKLFSHGLRCGRLSLTSLYSCPLIIFEFENASILVCNSCFILLMLSIFYASVRISLLFPWQVFLLNVFQFIYLIYNLNRCLLNLEWRLIVIQITRFDDWGTWTQRLFCMMRFWYVWIYLIQLDSVLYLCSNSFIYLLWYWVCCLWLWGEVFLPY